MEIMKFNHCMFRPPNLYVADTKLLFLSSIQRCSSGLYVRPFSAEDATSKHRRDYIQRRKLSFRNQVVATWCISKSNESFGKYNHKNKPRYIVARSELVGSGTPDTAYPLSESNVGSKHRGRLFYVVTSITAIILFNLMVLAHPFILLLDRYRRKAHYSIARIWALASVAPFFKITVKGMENLPASDTPAVYVSNHQSFLDIYTLLTLGRSFKFISKTAIFLYPIVGWAMFLMGVIPLRRMDSKSHMECLKRCMDLLKKGASVFFFPEGTRSRDGNLGVFKKGAFSVAAKCGVPVVPITLVGTGEIMPSGKESILNPGSVTVIIHKPIQGKDAEALCKGARDVIATGLDL